MIHRFSPSARVIKPGWGPSEGGEGPVGRAQGRGIPRTKLRGKKNPPPFTSFTTEPPKGGDP